MKRLLSCVFAVFLAVPAWADSTVPAQSGETFDEGIEYQRIVPEQPTDNPGKIEVVELFWYGCPHCNQFEPVINKWLETKPENVEFLRMPAVLNPGWDLLGKAFYTAEVLGVSDKIHAPLFHAIHVERRHMATPDDVAKFFEEQGVSRADFDKAFNSFAVDAKMRRAKVLGERYGISGVPSIVINGKYRTSGVMAGTYGKLLEVMDYLIAKESTGG